jgi:short-subunit dehydrogenase
MRPRVKLKKTRDQVIVITGASSGIGMITAKMAARRGARVILNGRDERALKEITEGIHREGGEADYFVGDVSDFFAMQRLAQFAVERFGWFDTWINNAGVHIFGRIEQTPEADARRLFDVNYWGVVHGCRAAVPFLRTHGGALLNVGSVLSSRSVPLQGHYGASKHAVHGYTSALRVELQAEGAPISVTLIKPSAIDTPIPMHSMNVMEERARLPFPMYDPQVAAKAILFCAESPQRDVVIGGAGKVALLGEEFVPWLTDSLMKLFLFRMQKTKGPRREENGLHSPPRHSPRERGEHNFYVARTSLYTWAERHRALTGVALAAAGIAARALWKVRR